MWTPGVSLRALYDACASGDLAAARAALAAVTQADNGNAASAVNVAFREACRDGHLDVARWLYDDVGGVWAHAYQDEVFRIVCIGGHLAIARWLHKHVGGVDAHVHDDAAFRHACGAGHLALAQWLYNDVRGVNVHAYHDHAFRDACMNGHLTLARWLYEDVGGVDVHAADDLAFKSACAKQHRDLALWLDSDEVWHGSHACAYRDKPAGCVAYVQGVRWSALRQQWISIVARGRRSEGETKVEERGASTVVSR